MKNSRKPAEKTEENVEKKLAAAPLDDQNGHWRQQHGKCNKNDKCKNAVSPHFVVFPPEKFRCSVKAGKKNSRFQLCDTRFQLCDAVEARQNGTREQQKPH